MTQLQPEQEIHAVVLLGDFNPAIFQPAWFSQNELLPREESEAAESLFLTKEITTFTVSSIHVQVDLARFALTTKDSAKAPVLRDLAIGCFTVLEHTPLNALGLNLDMEFIVPTEEEWNRVGHRLAPKGDWQGIIENPGMRALHMEGTRKGCTADLISIRVTPSRSQQSYGVFVRVNQHYNLSATKDSSVQSRNAKAMKILEEDWKSFRPFAIRSAIQLISGHQQPS